VPNHGSAGADEESEGRTSKTWSAEMKRRQQHVRLIYHTDLFDMS
jgi:hypothetical protein